MKNKHYGKQKIENTEVMDDGILLTFDNKTTVKLSAKMAEVALTDKPCDDTTLREMRMRPVAKEILQLILKWDVKVSEIEYLTSLIITSINQNIEDATDKLWKTPVLERTVKNVDKVLKDDGTK